MDESDKTLAKVIVLITAILSLSGIGGCAITEYYQNKNLQTGHHEQQRLGGEGYIWVQDYTNYEAVK